MKSTLIILLSLFLSTYSYSQSNADQEAVAKACMNYLDGFYQGDTTKIISSVMPRFHKMGFWKNRDTGKYAFDSYMTYQQAKNYAEQVMKDKRFVSEQAPKKVEVLDIMNHIASAKVTAWWGTDYLLLAKVDGTWMIEQVLWEGPLPK